MLSNRTSTVRFSFSLATLYSIYPAVMLIIKKRINMAENEIGNPNGSSPLSVESGAFATTLMAISPTYMAKAQDYYRQAQAIIEGSGGVASTAYAWQDMGEYYLDTGEIDEAVKYFNRGLNQPTQTIFLAKPLLLADSVRVADRAWQLGSSRRHSQASANLYRRKRSHLCPARCRSYGGSAGPGKGRGRSSTGIPCPGNSRSREDGNCFP